MMGVSLYVIRLLLNGLGVVDYGIFNVVAGTITALNFLSNSLASASQRFFSFEIGKNDSNNLKDTFSLLLLIFLLIAVFVILISETLGVWFLNNYLNIPDDRLFAANVVLQFSIFSFVTTILTIPYNAILFSNENMKVFALIRVFGDILRLLAAGSLFFVGVDKLIFYSALLFIINGIILFCFILYTTRLYPESRFSFFWEKERFLEVLFYSGWSLFGSISGVARNEGSNILLNIFFNPVVNAARGISIRIYNAINQFALSYFEAVKPQIIKSYSSGDFVKMFFLICQGSKFSYFLLYIISLPILVQSDYVLEFWLKEVPPFVEVFTKLVIIDALVNSLSFSLMAAAQATGRIRKYQIIVGGTQILNLPISYVFLKLHFPPETVLYIAIFLSLAGLGLRLFIVKELINFSILKYLKVVLSKVLFVTIVTTLIVFYFEQNICLTSKGWEFLLVGSFSFIITLFFVWVGGISQGEKIVFLNWMKFKLGNKNEKG